MTAASCRRWDEEALPRLEAGLALEDSHFDTCPDCRAAREADARLRAALAATGSDEHPPAGWQERVLATVAGRAERQRERRRGARRWWLGLSVAAGVAAGLTTLLVRSPGVSAIALEQRLVSTEAVTHRGEGAAPGDRLVLTATLGQASQAELRVYRNRRELVLRCSVESPCRRQGQKLAAELVLDGRGDYLPLLLVSSAALPEPAGGADADAQAAAEAGARVEPGQEVRVR